MSGMAKTTLWLSLAAAAPAPAHLQPGSLSSPAAGQGYAAGSQVTITWIQAEYHYGKYALAYSRDGAAWEPIAVWTGPSGDDITVSYAWTVPDAPGDSVRVRVCQIQNCADPDYVIVSGRFAIVPAAPVRPVADPARHPATLRVSAPEGRIRLAFDLERGGEASLDAFDARGAFLARLIDGPLPAGRHAVAAEADVLRRHAVPSFRLRLGGRSVPVRVLRTP